MTKDEALKMALETLETVPIEYDFHGNFMDAEFGKQLDATIKALCQALDQSPDTTKMIDTGTDRGAWSDVKNATQWVDELRGDDDIELAPPGNYAANTEPPTDSHIIAGAIYDFAGFITTRNKVIRVGATADAAPVADLVKEWADRRKLSLENAAVGWWQDVLEEPPNSTTDVVEDKTYNGWVLRKGV